MKITAAWVFGVLAIGYAIASPTTPQTEPSYLTSERQFQDNLSLLEDRFNKWNVAVNELSLTANKFNKRIVE